MSFSPERLSVNEICIEGWSSVDLIERCPTHDLRWVALWRHRVEEAGIDAVRRSLEATGVGVSSLCRGGMFTAGSAAEARAAIDDNLRAIEEAAALGAEALVLVCGPVVDRDLATGRRQVRKGLEAIVDRAREHSVRLAVEPLHPMMVADRSVIVTLGEALALVDDLPVETVGVAVDTYHIFWDPDLDSLIERAGNRIFGYQISDWVLPIEGGLSSRGLPGDGHIDLHGIDRLVSAAGFDGPIEVEVLSDNLWARPPADAFQAVLDAYASLDPALGRGPSRDLGD